MGPVARFAVYLNNSRRYSPEHPLGPQRATREALSRLNRCLAPALPRAHSGDCEPNRSTPAHARSLERTSETRLLGRAREHRREECSMPVLVPPSVMPHERNELHWSNLSRLQLAAVTTIENKSLFIAGTDRNQHPAPFPNLH